MTHSFFIKESIFQAVFSSKNKSVKKLPFKAPKQLSALNLLLQIPIRFGISKIYFKERPKVLSSDALMNSPLILKGLP